MALFTNGTTPAPASAAGRCLVVFGTKGGVGKTVVAINVAVSLAVRLRKPVCLIDLDLLAAGDVAKALNLAPARSIADLLTPGAAPVPIEQVMAPHPSGVHVLASLSHPSQLAKLNPQGLAALLEELKRRYAYVIIDGGRAFSEYLVTAFDAANLILMVATPDIITLYQTKWALSMVESLLFPSSMVKAVLNRAESRGGVDTRDVRAAIPCDVIAEIPSDGRVVGTALNQGQPIVTAFGDSKIAEAFIRLAETLVTKPHLYVTTSDIPRHQRPPETVELLKQTGFAFSSTRLYADNGNDQPIDASDEIVQMKRRIHDRLVQELDIKRLDLGTLSNNTQMQNLRQKVEPVVANLLAREVGGLVSSHEVRIRLVKEIVDEALGLGPLEELLADQEITDILVNSKDQIYVERHGKLELTAKKFVSNDQVRAVIERIVAPLGRRVDEANPMVDARLPDGSRVNAIIPPLSIKGPVLSIRKFGRVRYRQEDLIRFNTLSPAMCRFIEICVLARKNMIISGGTGSGKTTLLNIVSAFIPEDERILTIEDAAELKLVQRHWINLEARPANVESKGQVTIRELFRNALRMRPDRIIIGECRGEETLDMLQAMNTGHDGSMTTIHANSPKDVVSRLDSMVLMSSVDLPVRAIREMVASAVDVIVHTARLSDGSRKITAISEITSLTGEGEIVFRDLFVFRQLGVDPTGKVRGVFEPTGQMPTFLEDLKVKGILLDDSIFRVPDPAGAGG